MNREFTEAERGELLIAFGLTEPNGQQVVDAECFFRRAWVVWSTSDSGRRTDIVGVYSTPDRAALGAKGKGTWGTEGDIDEAIAFSFGNDPSRWYLLQSPRPHKHDKDFIEQERKARAEALAKLTPAEIKLLGINP